MYYYKLNNQQRAQVLTDDWMANHKPKRPKEVFEKDNGIKIWWHKNEINGKIDMNINMSDKDSRKSMAT